MTMNWKKIINDPVHGFISIPTKTIFNIIELPEFQRLRRIKQLGLTHLVYPGALHTRFHHALGAMHLMNDALHVLKTKGVKISKKEFEAALIAILLHDVGHGPFSHALERMFINVDHEEITLIIMKRINRKLKGKLDLAIKIFQGAYHKTFLTELVSSQLDVDRLDYLSRDSFFTGVAEGVIGYDRIIKMLNVDDKMNLVLEEKGIYSIEKFLLARRLMYLQVYLHKTVIAAEKMLLLLIRRLRKINNGHLEHFSPALKFFLTQKKPLELTQQTEDQILVNFLALDDIDVEQIFKSFYVTQDPIVRLISEGLINRQLFRCFLSDKPFTSKTISKIKTECVEALGFEEKYINELVETGKEKIVFSSNSNDRIKIRKKSNEIVNLRLFSNRYNKIDSEIKYFLCYPK